MMGLDHFKELLLSVDPETTKNKGNGKENYTIWTPYGENVAFAGGKRRAKAVRVQVDRFTKRDDDPIATAIYAALESSRKVAFSYLLDFELDTGYHHHIFDCEVIPDGKV